MLTPDDLECLKQFHEEHLAHSREYETNWHIACDVGRRLEVRLNQVLAERDELEKALDIKHAKLVEVSDNLRIERVCAKATRDLLDGIRNELRSIVNGRLTFGQMVLRIRRVLMEPTNDPLVVIDESTEIETLRKQADDVYADNLSLAGKLVVAEGRLKSATSILGRAISHKKSQWADDARRWLGNFPPCGSRING